MKSAARLAVILAAAAGGATTLATPALAGSAHDGGTVFVTTEGADGNAVVVYDSALHQQGSYPTGGKAGAGTTAAGFPAKCASAKVSTT